MSHWNYRIVRDGTYLCITEVYYDDKGKPNGYIPDGATFGCDDEEEQGKGREALVEALERALKAAKDTPILDASEMGHDIL